MPFQNLKKCAKDHLKKPPWISWVFWAESRPRMHKNRMFLGCHFHQKYKKIILNNKHNRNFLNILGLFCRFEEINILYSTKQKISLNITGSSLQNWRNQYFNYSTKHKKLFKYPGLPLQNWKKCAKDHLKKPPWISWVFWASKIKTQDAYLSQGWF